MRARRGPRAFSTEATGAKKKIGADVRAPRKTELSERNLSRETVQRRQR
jgi:hypothetical protein